MTEYLVRPKAASKIQWDGFNRACLGISLGNANERGEKFSAIVKWLSSKFDEVVIDLSDALYRWNEYDDSGSLAVNGKEKAIAKGDQWITENSGALNAFNIPYKISRWNNWLTHEDFFSVHHQIRGLYNSHSDFSHCMNMDIQKFMDRRKNLGLEVNPAVIQNCLNFLFEEMAVHTIRFRTLPNTMQIYPGDDLKSIRALRLGAVPGAPIGLQNVPLISLRIERCSEADESSTSISLCA